MDQARPSRTALAAAGHRAAHQVLEQGRIFPDPLALKILGDEAAAAFVRAERENASRATRFLIAARTKFSEDALEAAIAGGLRQVVILGAGLDTFAYRLPVGTNLRVFEVDHPATQAWKQERLRAAAIGEPAHVSYVPVDFEHEDVLSCLGQAGLDRGRATFFSWLGVVAYLQKSSVWLALRDIASIPNAEVVFDYSDPPETLDEAARRRHEDRAARVAKLGEAWLSYFDPDELRAGLVDLGFSRFEDLGPSQIGARYWEGSSSPSRKGPHFMWAAR